MIRCKAQGVVVKGLGLRVKGFAFVGQSSRGLKSCLKKDDGSAAARATSLRCTPQPCNSGTIDLIVTITGWRVHAALLGSIVRVQYGLQLPAATKNSTV